MHNKSRSQGSTSTIIVIVLVAVILSAVGYAFWRNSTQSASIMDTAQNTTTPTSTKAKAPAEQETATPPYTLRNATVDITKALASGECNGHGSPLKESDFIVVNDTDPFVYKGGKSLIDKSFTYAYAQYGCGSQGVVALLKKTEGSWNIVTEDARIYPLCNQIRGQGFPTSVIDKCYKDERSTEPVAID